MAACLQNRPGMLIVARTLISWWLLSMAQPWITRWWCVNLYGRMVERVRVQYICLADGSAGILLRGTS